VDPVERLYLDYNATSPLSQSVIDWLKSGDVLFANPSSQHSSGKATRKLINESRSFINSTFHQNEKDVNLVFHSGATEGIATFAYSFSEWARLTGKELLICYSKLDHPAVTSLVEHYYGPLVKFYELKIDQKLAYNHSENFAAIKDKKDNNPNLIILYHHLWVHNETGLVSDLEALKEFKSIPDLYLHIDAVQAPGKIPNWTDLKVGDVFTFSAHKFGALKGIGFSFFNKKISFHPLLSGGGQQSGQRSGTENPLGVQTVALALSDLKKVSIHETIKLREKLEAFLNKELKDLGGMISSLGTNRASNTIYFYLNDLSSDVALALFDLNGVMISAGSACSSGAAKASAVMAHLGYKEEAKNGLRISFAYNLNESELAKILSQLGACFQKIRSHK
jgi:cysteine desulfurase